mgnify:CR=1 FL=1
MKRKNIRNPKSFPHGFCWIGKSASQRKAGRESRSGLRIALEEIKAIAADIRGETTVRLADEALAEDEKNGGGE